MNISSAEWREREQYVVKIIDDVETILKNPKVQKALGANALTLYGVSQRIFLPNLRNGVLSMPKEYQDTDLVPMVALKQNEELRGDQSLVTMSMTQHEVMKGMLEEWREEDEILIDLFAEPVKSTEEFDEELIKKNKENKGFRVSIKGANGRVITTPIAARNLTDGRIHQALHGRPFVVLDTNEHHVEYEAASIALHEFEHVRQFMEDPLLPILQLILKRKRLEQELRAYRIQAEVGWGMDIATFRMIGSEVFRTTMADVRAIEDYRKRSVRFGHEYSDFKEKDETILLKLTGAGLPYDRGIEAA
jgi:hypothetical protein